MTEHIAHIDRNKKIQTCSEHSLNTAEIAGNLMSLLSLKNTAYISGLLHDMGKYTDEFQDYIIAAADEKKVKKGSVIHTFSGVSFLLNEYHCETEEIAKRLTAELIATAIGSHHGLFDLYDENYESGFGYRCNKHPKYEKIAKENFLSECCSKEKINGLFELSFNEIETVFNKIIDICNVNCENDKTLYFYLSLLSRLLTSAVIDADRQDTSCFMNNKTYFLQNSDSMLWDKCTDSINTYLQSIFQPSEISKTRSILSDLCFRAGGNETGIYRLNLPTGGGKTLSSLRFALNHAKIHNKERIIFVSPLLSIIDQNADVIRKAVNNDGIILEHHSNVVNDTESTEYDKYEELCENWDSPIIITTLVQLLNTLFSDKTSSVRRFHSLCNSVIIFDEVQTVPTKMLSLFNVAVNFLSEIGNSTVILCSATQPEFGYIKHKLHLSEKELISQNEIKPYLNVFRRNRIINKGNITSDEIPDFVRNICENNKSVLVVCNKKNEAVELYNSLSENGDNIYHLSASMCIAHRKSVLNKIKGSIAKGNKVICISTQVIEAGVDISFDTVIRYAAGMDSIVQAAGRCNRNGENVNISNVYSINCTDENLSKLPDIERGKKASYSLFYEYGKNPESFDSDLSSQKSVKFYYEKLYAELPKKHTEYAMKNMPSLFDLLSVNPWGKESEYILVQAFKTAGEQFEPLDSDQVTVIVPYEDGARISEEIISCCGNGNTEKLSSLLNLIKPYCISVQFYLYKELCDKKAIVELLDGRIKILDGSYYNTNTGLIKSKEENECSTLIL